METEFGQRPAATLVERLERWISIAERKGYGTMTEGDWAALESVLKAARQTIGEAYPALTADKLG